MTPDNQDGSQRTAAKTSKDALLYFLTFKNIVGVIVLGIGLFLLLYVFDSSISLVIGVNLLTETWFIHAFYLVILSTIGGYLVNQGIKVIGFSRILATILLCIGIILLVQLFWTAKVFIESDYQLSLFVIIGVIFYVIMVGIFLYVTSKGISFFIPSNEGNQRGMVKEPVQDAAGNAPSAPVPDSHAPLHTDQQPEARVSGPDQNSERSLSETDNRSFLEKNPGIIWSGIIGILVVILLLYAGLPHIASTPVTHSVNSATVPAVVTTDQTGIDVHPSLDQTQRDGMKTYTNQQYNYAISYPAKWSITGSGSRVTLSPSEGLMVQISPVEITGSLQDYFLNKAKEVDATTGADITNHDFVCTLGYRVDYVIRDSNNVGSTKVTEIFTGGHSQSQIFVITYRGSASGYDTYSGDFDTIIRSFHLV